MSEDKHYVCLNCGSEHGEPTDSGSENWWWRVFPHGRCGPFHSQECSRAFRLDQTDPEPRFTLMEVERLLFWRSRRQPEAPDAEPVPTFIKTQREGEAVWDEALSGWRPPILDGRKRRW